MRFARTAPPLAALISAALVASTGCGGATQPTDPLSLIQGALAQQYFDAHHTIPSNQQENLLAREAKGMLAHIYTLPPPPSAATTPQVDIRAVRDAHGSDAVDLALLATYILHFGALPDDYTQSQIGILAGSGGAPLPVIGKHP